MIEILVAYRVSGKNIVSVSCVACAMFLLSTIIYVASDDYYGYEISWKSVVAITILLFCIILGELFGSKIVFRRVIIKKNIFERYEMVSVNTVICILFSIFILFVSVYYFIDVFLFSLKVGNTSGSIWNMATYVRHANLDSSIVYEKNTIISQGTLISSCLVYFSIYCFFYNRIYFGVNQTRFILPVVTYIPQILASDSRTGLLNSICVICIIIFVLIKDHNNWVSKDNRKVIRIAFFSIIVFLALFRLLGYRTGASVSNALWDNLVEYTSAGIVGFDYFMIEGRTPSEHFGSLTLKEIYKKFEKIGIISGYTKTGRAGHGKFFFYARGHSNIYTAFMSYIDDYSFVGAMFAFFLWGVSITYLLKSVKKGNISFTRVCILGVLFYPVAMISIGDVTSTVLSMSSIYMIIYLKLIELVFFKRKLILSNK